jgi:predicted ATPase/DNA-binding SARP family transcriptional activator
MRFGILGSLEVVRDGNPVAVTAPMQRAVLAALLLRPGRVVAAEELIEQLWGDRPPRTARVTLQTYVLRLRRTLGGLSPDSVIATAAPGYLVRVDPEQVDLHRFDRLVARARDLRKQGGTGPAADALDEALRLWRGRPLADVGAEHLRRTEAPSLEERRMRALEEWLDLGLELGRHAELLDELTGLVAAHPLSERLRGHLLTALYRSGRPGDALRAYRDAREALVRELGIEPGPELQALHAAMLSRDPALEPRPHRPAHPLRSPAARGCPAPAQRSTGPLTRFVGRTEETRQLRGLLGDARLVTVTGPAGCGKSRLVRHALAELPGRPHHAELARLATADGLPRLVATALGVPVESGRSAVVGIAERLRDRPALLVLDDCEHLVGACAELAVELLDRCPAMRILATSREPLAIRTEHVLRLRPLPDHDATALFIDRARAARPGFAVTPALSPRVREVVRRLGGLPLALELAAARLGALPMEEVRASLDDQLGLLAGGDRTGRPEHRSLRAAVRRSDELLEPAERRLFHVVSVFAGGFTTGAAAAVHAAAGGDGADVPELLGGLATKSVVLVEPAADRVRYRLPEPLRQFARQRLRGYDVEARCLDRHAGWYAERAGGGAELPAAEAADLRAALSWSVTTERPEQARQLAAALDRLGPLAASQPPHQAGVPPDWADPVPAGTLSYRELAVLGTAAAARGRYARALTLHSRAARCAAGAGRTAALADNLLAVADLQAQLGRTRSARALLDRAAHAYLAVEDAAGLAVVALRRAEAEAYGGDLALARRLLPEALDRLDRLDRPAETARGRLALGRAALELGDLPLARHQLTAALRGLARVGDRQRLATALELLGETAADGPTDRAVTLLAAAAAVREMLEPAARPPCSAAAERQLDRLRQRLGPTEFAVAWQRGSSRTVADLVRYACTGDR